jgi:nucleoside-diphosphate-sugar epimerase
VHAASYVGADPDRCERVNHQGTRRLVEEADRAGVAAFVQVSTAAVYGTGPHRGPDEQCLPPAPESPTSASRAAGERWVLAAGGTVLRPHLVYGVGDRWVIPTLARLLAVLPGWIDGGRALTSVVAVSELARLTAALTLAPTVAGSGGTVLHANHPKPVSIRELGLTVAGLLGLRVPEGTVRRGDVRAHLDGLPVHSRHLDMLAVDHWYDSNRIWRVSGCRPGPDPLGELPASASWYAAALTGATT